MERTTNTTLERTTLERTSSTAVGLVETTTISILAFRLAKLLSVVRLFSPFLTHRSDIGRCTQNPSLDPRPTRPRRLRALPPPRLRAPRPPPALPPLLRALLPTAPYSLRLEKLLYVPSFSILDERLLTVHCRSRPRREIFEWFPSPSTCPPERLSPTSGELVRPISHSFPLSFESNSSLIVLRFAGPHTVTQSSPLAICNKTLEEGAYASGQQNATHKFPVVIKQDSKPTYYFCGVKTHCQMGMSVLSFLLLRVGA